MNTAERITGTIRLTPLTPVHIGSGGVFTELDYTIRKDRFEVKDVHAFFEAHRDSVDYALDAVANGLVLEPEFTRYALPAYVRKMEANQPGPPRGRGGGGAPREHQDKGSGAFNNPFAALKGDAGEAKPEPARPSSQRTPTKSTAQSDPGFTVGEVREFIKDPFGRPFIPGSSVKGSIRTAIAWALAEAIPLGRMIDDVLRDQRLRKEWASTKITQALFGADPNKDVLRALRIADSRPLDVAAPFACCHVKVMNLFRERFSEKPGVPIHAECLMPGTPVDLPFHIDRFALANDQDLAKASNGKAAQMLNDQGQLDQALSSATRRLLDYERKFYDARGVNDQVAFIDRLRGEASMLLATGFGTGWHAKTLGVCMAPGEVESVRQRFGRNRDGRPNKGMGTPGADVFPKTRKWGNGPGGYRPMGWLKMEILWG